MGGLVAKISRKKPLEYVTPDTSLRRCLNTFDLTLMGMGSMIGSGIYVMTGKVCRDQAGPAIVLSFVFAAVVVLMVAGCFTELAARTHRTGSTYLYVYLSLGELPAFLVGFATICICILGGSTNARAWSAYMDSVFNGAVSNYTRTTIAEWDIGPPIADYPDFVAMGIVLFMTLIIALGAKCSSWFNTLFALVNVLILGFVIIVGLLYADVSNWTSEESGGFMPFGFSGVLSGSAVCFWAFSGFEILSCAVEESRNPKKDIPIATVTALVTVTILYVGTTASLTLVTPYYNIDTDAPLPSAFAAKGLYWAQLVVAIGPLCGLTTTMMSSLYSFVRIAYKISEDGLLFSFMSQVNDCSKVPVLSIVLSGILMSIIALCLDLSELISFSVILILTSYSLVCGSVIILRYTPEAAGSSLSSDATVFSISDDTDEEEGHTHLEMAADNHQEVFDDAEDTDRENLELQNDTNIGSHMTANGKARRKDTNGNKAHTPVTFQQASDIYSNAGGGLRKGCAWLWPCNRLQPGRWPCVAIFIQALALLLTAVVTVYFKEEFLQGTWWAVILFTVSLVLLLVLLATVFAHQQNLKGLTVKMPCVPLLPTVSMCLCLYLLVSTATLSNWIGCFGLLSIGLILYFSYGIRHSKLNTMAYQQISVASLEGASVTLLDHQSTDEDEDGF